MDEEWQYLLNACFDLVKKCKTGLNRDPLRRLLTLRTTPEQKKQITLILARNLHFEVPYYETELKKKVGNIEVWAKILTSPEKELPTLIGIREDLDELIAKRMKHG